jgi:hypothetical protein
MSTFQPKPNSGVIFYNEKAGPNHPDMRGDLNLDRQFLKKILSDTEGDLVKLSIACWNKTSSAGKEYMSCSVSEPFVKRDAAPNPAPTPTPSDREDVPF